MGPTGNAYRVVQIHPTRRCNLQCVHCYSTSGPHASEQLPLDLVRGLLEDAGEEGYNVAGLSGGEPTLYPWLSEVLASAHERGMRTTVTSHGMLLSERLLDKLQGHLDLLAISLDGVPESHNRMRGSTSAFALMEQRLPAVRQSGVRFGFIFTLTQYNLHELEWVTRFAVEQGAGLLQIHPLEETGRAAYAVPGSEPDEVEASVAFLEVCRLQEKYGAQIRFQLDLLDRRLIVANPERVMAAPVADANGQPLSALVSPIIVEPDGTVVPVHYGFDRRFAFGNLYEQRLSALTPEWRSARLEEFLTICRRAFDDLIVPTDLPFVNWYPFFAKRSEQSVADKAESTA